MVCEEIELLLNVGVRNDFANRIATHRSSHWLLSCRLYEPRPENRYRRLVHVGIHANVTSPREFVIEFEEFKITRKP
jgi:hypothetical protein